MFFFLLNDLSDLYWMLNLKKSVIGKKSYQNICRLGSFYIFLITLEQIQKESRQFCRASALKVIQTKTWLICLYEFVLVFFLIYLPGCSVCIVTTYIIQTLWEHPGTSGKFSSVSCNIDDHLHFIGCSNAVQHKLSWLKAILPLLWFAVLCTRRHKEMEISYRWGVASDNLTPEAGLTVELKEPKHWELFTETS